MNHRDFENAGHYQNNRQGTPCEFLPGESPFDDSLGSIFSQEPSLPSTMIDHRGLYRECLSNQLEQKKMCNDQNLDYKLLGTLLERHESHSSGAKTRAPLRPLVLVFCSFAMAYFVLAVWHCIFR